MRATTWRQRQRSAATWVVAAAALVPAVAIGSHVDARGATVTSATVTSVGVPASTGVEGYWTAERMATATPADLTPADAIPAASANRAVAAADTPFVSPPKLAPVGTKVLDPSPAAVPVPRPYENLPDRTVGKVFFTGVRGDQTCSAVALNSDNKSVVWTAGHCVEAGASGGFHRNWVFVPGYGSCGGGCRPYGTFRATTLLTTTAWADTGDFRYDVGAAVVAPVGGRKLVATVGGQGFAGGQPDGALFHAIGYPADPPFTGRRQLQCTGPSTGRDVELGAGGPEPLALACDLTGGASGGPWLVGLGENGYGYVNGNVSYRYGRDPSTLYSPFYGDVVVALFLEASTTPLR